MGTGADILLRIDTVTRERHTTRGAMCEKLGISRSTLSSWNAENCYPKTDIIAKIADYLEVSTDWLINGNNYSALEEASIKAEREKVIERIKLRLDLQVEKSDITKPQSSIDWEITFKPNQYVRYITYLDDILSEDRLYNWSKCRCEIRYSSFEKIASRLKTSVQYLMKGNTDSINTPYDTNLYSLAEENKSELLCYSQLTPENKAKIKSILEDTYKLQTLEGKK